MLNSKKIIEKIKYEIDFLNIDIYINRSAGFFYRLINFIFFKIAPSGLFKYKLLDKVLMLRLKLTLSNWEGFKQLNALIKKLSIREILRLN